MKNWLNWVRCEAIYLLGGIPKEHINTLNYRNIGALMSNLRKQIDASTTT